MKKRNKTAISSEDFENEIKEKNKEKSLLSKISFEK